MYKRTITMRLRETDATGVLYFPEQFRFALETFEAYLETTKPLKALLEQGSYLLPVVHAEANYAAALRVGDKIEVTLTLGPLGTSSFELRYQLLHLDQTKKAGDVRIVHVVIDRETRTPSPIPPDLRKLLLPLQETQCW